MVYAFFVAGMISLVISVVFAIKNRYDAKKCISAVTLGVLFTTFFMVLPTEWVKQGKAVTNPALYSVLSSILYSFKALGGRQDIAQLETVALPCILKTIYICVNYLLFALAPILASSLVLSFIGDTGERLRYFLSFSPKCHVFSEVNENTVALAKGIKASDKRKTIVFCNTKKANDELLTEAKKLGGIALHKSCENLPLLARIKEYEFYFLSETEDKNTRLAKQLIERKNKFGNKKIIVNSFAKSGTDIEIIESAVSDSEDERLKIRFIDEIALLCSNIVFTHPLFDLPDGNKDISVLIAGCGRMGMQMLKTICRSGQIDGFSLKIRVLDKNANSIEKELYLQCPELDNYDIRFYDVDFESVEFERRINSFTDTTFVCVATGSDELNVTTAENIYRVFRRRYDGRIPPIFARVRQSIKSDNFEKSSTELQGRGIHLFGKTDYVFSKDRLFCSELENLALAVHLCYNDVLDKSKDSSEYQNALDEFYCSEYSRRSSMAAAMHIPCKLASFGIKAQGLQFTDAQLGKFSELLKDADTKERIMKNEHERWNAFMRSEGFRTVDFETVKRYAPFTGSHKDEAAKLHPCIIPWDELDSLQERYDELQKELGLKENNFKMYDRLLVTKIPEIINRAKQLEKEGW